MIRLQPVPRPPELTDVLAQQLTDEFLKTGASVWNRDFIKKALLAMSSGKCCYCECRVDEESKYMEVEHFNCKSSHPHLVVIWKNLLPSCKRCNGQKSDHDTAIEPIVHPVNDEPREHLRLRAYRFYGKTELGKASVRVLNLNDRERLQDVRYKIGSKTKDLLDRLEEDLREFQTSPGTAIRLRNLTTRLREIMLEGQPTEPYSATVATEILREDSFDFAKQFLTENGRWDEEFQRLENALWQIAFDE